MVILYEDKEIIVVNKSSGLLSVSTDREKEKTVHARLNSYVRKGNSKSKNRVYIVHRLDKHTSGVLVFTKSENAKRYLQEIWSEFDKTYFAIVHGKMKTNEGEITSYLTENAANRVYSVKNESEGKFAQTNYLVLRETHKFSLVKINLVTGKKNQIRVHFSEKGNPVVGDKMYGFNDKEIKRLCLHSASLTLRHPFTFMLMTFETEVPLYMRTLVNY